MQNKRIAIFYTGGTIGMMQSDDGLKPNANLHQKLLLDYSDYLGDAQIDWFNADEIIDSSALTLFHWQSWIAWLRQHITNYDGVVVLHGTDTLAYTANILALVFADVMKPIVITGAQYPMGTKNGDAQRNFQAALSAVVWGRCPQVSIVFDQCLWRAIGSCKVSTETFAGILTPHYPPIARLSDGDIWQEESVYHTVVLPDSWLQPVIRPDVCVVCYTLCPGGNIDMITHSLHNFQADGIVLETYGHGNAPNDEDFLKALTTVIQQGIPVINVSQVLQGQVAQVYAQGQILQTCGVLSGGKHNKETAVALLTLAVANHWNTTDIQTWLSRD